MSSGPGDIFVVVKSGFLTCFSTTASKTKSTFVFFTKRNRLGIYTSKEIKNLQCSKRKSSLYLWDWLPRDFLIFNKSSGIF